MCSVEWPQGSQASRFTWPFNTQVMIPQGYPKVKKEFLTFSKFLLLSGCCLLFAPLHPSCHHCPPPPFIPQAPFCTSFRKDLLRVWELQGELVYCRHRQWHPLQCSCLENPTDGGGWWATVHGGAKSRTRLSDFSLSLSQAQDRKR